MSAPRTATFLKLGNNAVGDSAVVVQPKVVCLYRLNLGAKFLNCDTSNGFTESSGNPLQSNGIGRFARQAGVMSHLLFWTGECGTVYRLAQ